MSRIARLAALLEEPLLVAGPPYVLGGQANVRYLTGLQSSNAAVLVEPDGGATLYTDFRYASRARALEGVEVVEAARGLIPAIGELLAGRRIAFERAESPHALYLRARRCRRRCAVHVGTSVEALRAVKDEAEIAAMRRASRSPTRSSRRCSRERFTGRTERELAWWVESGFREAGAEGVVVRGHRRRRPDTPRRRTRSRATSPIEPGVLVVDRRRLRRRRLLLRTARGRSPSASVSERLAELHALCLEAQLAGLAGGRAGRSHGRDADAASRTRIEEARPRLGLRPRHGARRRAADPRGAHAAPGVDGRARGRKRRLRRAGHLPAGRGAGVRIEDRRPRDRRRLRASDAASRRNWSTVVVTTLPPLHGRDRLHEPVPATGCTSSSTATSAHRRVPAREAGQGRRVRAHEAQEPRGRRRRRPDVPRAARSSPACTPR